MHPEGSSGDPGTARGRPRGSGGSSGECRGQGSRPAENSQRTGGGDVQLVVGRWCEGSGGDEGSFALVLALEGSREPGSLARGAGRQWLSDLDWRRTNVEAGRTHGSTNRGPPGRRPQVYLCRFELSKFIETSI